jgi:hypothetical protein
MALRSNGYQFQSSGVYHAGVAAVLSALPSVLQGNFWQTGRIRNLTAGEGITSDKVGIPNGARHPVAWMMPQKTGGLSSHNNAQGTATASATPISLRGVIANTCTVNGAINAALLMAGTAAGTTPIASLQKSAQAYCVGSSAGTATGTLVSYGLGVLRGSITPFTDLSPQGLAQYLLEYAEASPIASNVKKVNSYTVDGDGQAGSEWGPV